MEVTPKTRGRTTMKCSISTAGKVCKTKTVNMLKNLCTPTFTESLFLAAKVSVSAGMHTENVVYPCNEILFRSEKGPYPLE